MTKQATAVRASAPQPTVVTPETRAAQRPAAAELPTSVFAASPAASSAAEPVDPKKAQRLQKIQQITFDRRPSSILRAWSSPDDPADAEPASASSSLATARIRAGVAPAVPASATASPVKPDPFDLELRTLQRAVTLGDWAAVKAFLAKLPDDEGKPLYRRLLDTLASPAQDFGMPAQAAAMNVRMAQMMPNMGMFFEKNALSNADVIALASAAPKKLESDEIEALGRCLRSAIDQGHAVEDFVARLRAGLKDAELAKGRAGNARVAGFPISQREAVKLLFAAASAPEAGEFLPTPEEAQARDDREGLNLLSRYYIALHAKEKKPEYLERAWAVTQSALAAGKLDRKDKDEALTRAVELAVTVRAELGRTWLEESFTRRPERGMEIIAAIGGASSRGIQTHPMDADSRKKALELQKTAVEALLKASPERAKGWSESLGLLASAWLAEAEFSRQFDDSTSLGPMMRRDRFGNVYWVNDDGMMMPNMMRNPNMPRAVRVSDVLDARPGDSWVQRLDPALVPKFASVCSQLYLKVGEDSLAFPYISALSRTHPEKARELAEEFVRVWTRNHDLNSDRNRSNPYIFIFGFERKAESIPLTRSKQERNLRELSDWVKKIRALPIGGLDEALLAKAFTTCHSSAEVYRVEAIESVFGSLDGLKPETLAELVQQMRTNLVGLWRRPAVQEQNKTRRTEKDIRTEVLRGYEVAKAVVESGLKTYPDHWALVLAGAAVAHDENNYRQELEPTLRFSKTRGEALARFRNAAALYAASAGKLPEEKETAQPFQQWFYASLGASDLAAIDEKAVADPRQPALIRAAILALPGAAADRHMAKFANDLFTRMTGLNPSVKFRYLKGGFEIVGDRQEAHEARKVFDYYKDLVTEIKLDAKVDGSTDVGHGRPFGLFVNLRHTREIERESGGFGRYLQNQNSPGVFFYNYGRPLENYRDKFQEVATKALQEQFQVLSVTFQDEKVHSKATAEYGWRLTPYAYILLKARSPEVDRVPPLRLDLDFLDTSGYVILPAESPPVPIDAAKTTPPVRPVEQLKLTQTLDERQAKDGKLIVETKAVARGLVPELDALLDLKTPGFHVTKADAQGLSVSRFDPESDEPAVLSERSWLITYLADEGLTKFPETFAFPKPRVETTEAAYQRYVDADLAQVKPVVALEERYGQPSRAWIGWTAGAGVLALVAGTVAWRLRRRAPKVRAERFGMPDPLTPFTVLGLLRDIQANNGLSDAKQAELAASIHRIEREYFAETTEEPHNLRELASTWIRQVS
jgi:hypothetical protein